MQTQPERARLTLATTGSRVTTEVARRTPEGMTVVQRLPFLKLRSGVTDATGRQARIEWVSVDIDGDTPAIVMELVYDRPARADMTEPDVGTYVRRRDDTAPYAFERASTESLDALPEHEIAIPTPVLPVVRPRRRWYQRFVDDFFAVWTELRRDFRRLARVILPA